MGICDNRVVIITGAGGGLGAAHAKVFAQQGASVIAVSYTHLTLPTSDLV